MNKFDQIVETVNCIKSDLAEAVSSKGVSTPLDATFTEIKSNIEQITGGGGYQPGDIIPGNQIELLPFLIKEVTESYAQHVIELDNQFVLVGNTLYYYDKSLNKEEKKIRLSGVDLDNCHLDPVIVKDLLFGATYQNDFFIHGTLSANLIKKFPLSDIGCILNNFIIESDVFYIPYGQMLVKYDFEGNEMRSYHTGLPTINTSNYCNMHKKGDVIYYLNKNYYVQMTISDYDNEGYIPKGINLTEFTSLYNALFFDNYFVLFTNKGLHYYEYGQTPKLIKTISKSMSTRTSLKIKVINERIYFSYMNGFYYVTEDYALTQIPLTNLDGEVIGFDYVSDTNRFYVWSISKLMCLDSSYASDWEYAFTRTGGADYFFKNMLTTTDNKLLFSNGKSFLKTELEPIYRLKYNTLI